MWYKLEIKNEVMFVSGKVQKDASQWVPNQAIFATTKF